MKRLWHWLQCKFDRHQDILAATDSYSSYDVIVPVEWFQCRHCKRVRKEIQWNRCRSIYRGRHLHVEPPQGSGIPRVIPPATRVL